MSTIEHMLPVEEQHGILWQRYLLDSVLAFVGSMLVTGIIYYFKLYPRIPNISIVYLLVVLALASIRGRYASILASLVAFFSFDFFLVPPLYVFTINRAEEWIALTLVEIARERQVTQLVLGQPARSHWEELLRGSTINRVLRMSRDTDIHLVPLERNEDEG